MQDFIPWLLIVSGISFLIYGISCLVSPHMREEFRRFGLPRFRVLVGWLEVLGGAGQLLYGWLPAVGIAATAGLLALMVMGVLTRIKIGDSLVVMLPALVFLLLNGFLVWFFFVPH